MKVNDVEKDLPWWVGTIVLIAIFFVIDVLWNAIDIAEFGSAQPSIADSIFGIILTFSLREKAMKKINHYCKDLEITVNEREKK